MQTVVRANLRVANQDDRFVYIEGVANDAHVTDSYHTRFRFTDECVRASEGIKLLFNHNPDFIVGAVEKLWREDGSLLFRARVRRSAKTPGGDEVGELVEDGLLNEASIHFDRDATYERGTEYDTITPNHLNEISLTPVPSNRGSKFSRRFLETLRQLEGENPEAHVLARALRLGMEALGEDEASEERKVPTFVRDSGPLDHDTLRTRLWRLLEERDSEWAPGLVAVYDEYIVYYDYRDNTLYKVDYAVDERGTVTLGDTPSEVLMTFAEVGAESDMDETRSTDLGEVLAQLERVREDLGTKLEDVQARLATLEAPEAEPEIEEAEGERGEELDFDAISAMIAEETRKVFGEAG